MPRSGGTSKGEILRVFAGMVADHGYDEATFREVAEQLDISKGTIVHHYGTKEQLLEAVHREYMKRRLAEAAVILDTWSDTSEQLVAMIAQLMICQRDDRDATVTFAREIARFSAMEVMKDVRGMRSQYTQLVHDIVARGVAEGTFAAADVDLVTLQVFGMCNWSWTWWRTGQAWSLVDIVTSFSSTLLSGLLARPGALAVDVADVVSRVEAVVAASAEGA